MLTGRFKNGTVTAIIVRRAVVEEGYSLFEFARACFPDPDWAFGFLGRIDSRLGLGLGSRRSASWRDSW